MSTSARLTHFLTAPSKVANALDWKKLSGSVMALNISRDEIDLTLASHPSCNSIEPQEQLESIPLHFITKHNRKCLDSEVVASLNNVVQQHKVCGFVVHWPLQKEGRMGASCGRVLHTLDGLLLDSQTPMLSNNRKFCLWDGSHIALEDDDAFGRCSLYGRPSTADADFVHVASREQYNQNEGAVALDVWKDFSQTHWPELSHTTPVTDDVVFDEAWLDNFEEHGARFEASAL